LKAIESRPHWKRKSTPGHGDGGSGDAGGLNKQQRFDELVAKQIKGDKLTQTELKQLNVLGTELKAAQKGN